MCTISLWTLVCKVRLSRSEPYKIFILTVENCNITRVVKFLLGEGCRGFWILAVLFIWSTLFWFYCRKLSVFSRRLGGTVRQPTVILVFSVSSWLHKSLLQSGHLVRSLGAPFHWCVTRFYHIVLNILIYLINKVATVDYNHLETDRLNLSCVRSCKPFS